MVDIATLPEDELNNDFRIAHNEKEFCELALCAGLETYNGDDMREQIKKAEHIMNVISAELKRRLTQRALDGGWTCAFCGLHNHESVLNRCCWCKTRRQ